MSRVESEFIIHAFEGRYEFEFEAQRTELREIQSIVTLVAVDCYVIIFFT
jgi:hypothetical protein